MNPHRPQPLPDADYQGLLTFRNELRGFLRWSEDRPTTPA